MRKVLGHAFENLFLFVIALCLCLGLQPNSTCCGMIFIECCRTWSKCPMNRWAVSGKHGFVSAWDLPMILAVLAQGEGEDLHQTQLRLETHLRCGPAHLVGFGVVGLWDGCYVFSTHNSKLQSSLCPPPPPTHNTLNSLVLFDAGHHMGIYLTVLAGHKLQHGLFKKTGPRFPSQFCHLQDNSVCTLGFDSHWKSVGP